MDRYGDTCNNNIRERRSMEVDRFAPTIPMLLPQTTYHTYVYQLGHHHSEITTTICHRLPLPTTTFLHYLPPPTATYHYRYHSWRHLRDLRATFMNETHVRTTWPFLSKSWFSNFPLPPPPPPPPTSFSPRFLVISIIDYYNYSSLFFVSLRLLYMIRMNTEIWNLEDAWSIRSNDPSIFFFFFRTRRKNLLGKNLLSVPRTYFLDDVRWDVKHFSKDFS